MHQELKILENVDIVQKVGGHRWVDEVSGWTNRWRMTAKVKREEEVKEGEGDGGRKEKLTLLHQSSCGEIFTWCGGGCRSNSGYSLNWKSNKHDLIERRKSDSMWRCRWSISLTCGLHEDHLVTLNLIPIDGSQQDFVLCGGAELLYQVGVDVSVHHRLTDVYRWGQTTWAG